MSYLQWSLDRGKGIDFVEPTGDFYLIGDEGEIIEKFTSIDIFLKF